MIVFLLRHADRTTAGDDLRVPEGVERANLLATMLSATGMSVAFCSDANRAKKTLEPLKTALGASLRVDPIKFGSGDTEDTYGRKVADAVRALPNTATVAVVGHSNTVGPTIKHLGSGPIEKIEDHQFDKLFILLIAPDGTVTLLQSRYGAST